MQFIKSQLILLVKNKLIIESGSTKTDWVIITASQNLKFTTLGINPAANENLFDLNQECADLLKHSNTISEIHYFGAGVIDDKTRLIIRDWLDIYFKQTENFTIESDMLGAAKAVARDKAGIISILGTGSNSCVYDGNEIKANIPALGFALSNEGGGSKIGGELIKAYFYKKLPEDVRDEFEQRFKISKSDVVEQIYKGDNPTAYLANYARFLNETENKEWRKSFLFPLFQEFIDIRIKQYSEYLQYDLHFVGSIAYFYADVIRDILQYNGLQCSSIIQKPIDGLVDYYK